MRRVVGIAEGQLRNRRRRRLWCLLVAVGLATTPAPTAAQGVPDDFVIKLERTECYGECPVYSVSIDARGNVTYEGTKFVWVLRRQTDRIQVSRVATLLATAERIGFFDLHDNYNTISNPDGTWTFLTDLPTAFVTVTRGGRSKRVRDYLGAPEALKELEHLIDDTAGTKRWIRLDAQTLQQLVRDGWLPSRRTRTELLRKALQGDEVDMVKALLGIGADPNAASSRGKTPLRTVRSAAAARVARGGRHPLRKRRQ